MAHECLCIYNFFGMGAIMCGLNNSLIQSFKPDWKKLNENTKKLFSKMEEILSPHLNFSYYRKLVEDVKLKGEPYIPYIAIHLRDISSIQETFEKSKEIYENILQVIDNGKKIWSILSAQKREHQIEKDEEMFNYLIHAKYLSSEQIYDMQFRTTSLPQSQFESEKSNFKKKLKRSNSFFFEENKILIKKASNLFLEEEISTKDTKLLLEEYQKKHSYRNHLYTLKKRNLKKYSFSNDDYDLLFFWNELKSLFVAESNNLPSKFEYTKRKYFSDPESKVKFFYFSFSFYF